ncbi:MAG: DNA repair protein RecO [Dethiobacteria bacterium]|nr:DNA repair protein RecO [Bacillota bacterium]MDW7729167.1 DNA repair protein RecO [Bacillota bacterium]
MGERIFTAEGLIIRTRILGEADRIVTLLTREEGKFEAVARGARKTKSKLAAGVDIFTHGRFTFHRGRTWPIITGFDSIERFNWFRDDPDLYPYGLYLAELTDRFNSGEESCPELFQLLLDGWKLFGGNIDRALLCRAFELKMANCGGYSPQLQCCTVCGCDKSPSFSPRQGGLVCSGCSGADSVKITAGALALARHLIETPLEQVSKLRAGPEQKKELAGLTASFFAYHLELGELKTRRLLPE